jgi:alpha-2-macroglobulin
MLPSLRAGLVAALVAFSPFSAHAADKAYVRDDLADSAIRLEAQIKKDTGPVTKPVATLRREADAAFAKNDHRAGMQALSQVVVVAPDDAASWLRLSRAILQVWDPP